MDDRELLELAAKAVGIPPIVDQHGVFNTFWDPLVNDGDALVLAVRLSIDPCQVPHMGYVEAWYQIGESGPEIQRQEYNGDPFAATRRAIVRAAAAIGRAM